jgi:hypothetical protein
MATGVGSLAHPGRAPSAFVTDYFRPLDDARSPWIRTDVADRGTEVPVEPLIGSRCPGAEPEKS